MKIYSKKIFQLWWGGWAGCLECISPVGIPGSNSSLPYITLLWQSIPWHTIQCYTIPYPTIQLHTIPYSALQYHTVPYHTVMCNTILYDTIPYHTMGNTGSNSSRSCHHSPLSTILLIKWMSSQAYCVTTQF